MASTQFRRMQKQVSILKLALLPRDINRDILELNARVSMRALSYRILCHAEFENYLEDRVLEVAAAADLAWKDRGHVSRVTFCLLAFSGRSLDKLPESLKAPPQKKQSDWGRLIRPDDRLSKTISEYMYRIRNMNNGIKEKDIISMLLPVSFNPDKIDEVLLSDLNDMGVKRGEAAHSSTSGQVTKGVNPKDEFLQVKRIVDGLKSIDFEIDGLLKLAR